MRNKERERLESPERMEEKHGEVKGWRNDEMKGKYGRMERSRGGGRWDVAMERMIER